MNIPIHLTWEGLRIDACSAELRNAVKSRVLPPRSGCCLCFPLVCWPSVSLCRFRLLSGRNGQLRLRGFVFGSLRRVFREPPLALEVLDE